MIVQPKSKIGVFTTKEKVDLEWEENPDLKIRTDIKTILKDGTTYHHTVFMGEFNYLQFIYDVTSCAEITGRAIPKTKPFEMLDALGEEQLMYKDNL